MMTSVPASWLSSALSSKLICAQVREDPLLEAAVLRGVGRKLHMMMVASGGCTAAYLVARSSLARLHLVDVNAAQLALTRLKLRLLSRPRRRRLELLGHAPLPEDERARMFQNICGEIGVDPDIFGSQAQAMGLDQCGRQEQLFAAVRARLQRWQEGLQALMRLRDPARQAECYAGALEQAVTRALGQVMSQADLEHFFGPDANGDQLQGLAQHLADRIRWAVVSLPAATNPYLSQLLLGTYQRTAAPWFSAGRPAQLPEIRYQQCELTHALASGDEPLDLIHCSHVLDHLDQADASRLLASCRRRLRPGGAVIIRQLHAGPGHSSLRTAPAVVAAGHPPASARSQLHLPRDPHRHPLRVPGLPRSPEHGGSCGALDRGCGP